MAYFSDSELDAMSRALECALTRLRGNPQADVTAAELATQIVNAAVEGVRCEDALAEHALAYAASKPEAAAGKRRVRREI